MNDKPEILAQLKALNYYIILEQLNNNKTLKIKWNKKEKKLKIYTEELKIVDFAERGKGKAERGRE